MNRATMTKRLGKASLAVLFFLPLASLAAGDAWPSAGDSAALTNSDCGVVSSMEGAPRVRRVFMIASDPDETLYVSDRLHAGDGLNVPADGHLEWTTGHNTIVTLGPDAKARLLGLRKSAFQAKAASPARLDIELLHGEIRVEVRRNATRPEAVMVSLPGLEVLVEQGDVQVGLEGPNRVTVLDGSASVRVRRGDVPGAPFTIDAGRRLGPEGPEAAPREALESIHRELPFSFERAKAALPPLPAASAAVDAP